MAVVNNESVPFYQAIHLTKRFRLGTIKTDVAGNQYRYGSGIGSTAAGDWVVFDSGYATTRLTNAVNGGLAGVSMSANTTSTNFSWYQVLGVTPSAVPANIATASSNGLGLFASGTGGRATSTPAATKAIFGAISVQNASNNLGSAALANPFYFNQGTLD